MAELYLFSQIKISKVREKLMDDVIPMSFIHKYCIESANLDGSARKFL